MGGISESFYDENRFFDRHIMNSPVLSASCYDVSKDVMISSLAARKITPADPDEDFINYAMSCCPELKDQGDITRSNLIKAAAMVRDKETQLVFLKNFSRSGVRKLSEEGKSEFYLIYDLDTPEVTCFVLTQLVLMKDTSSGDLIAAFITKDISRLKQFRKIVTMAVNSVCECISVIDTESRTIAFESGSDDFTKRLSELGIEGRLDYDTEFKDILNTTAKCTGEVPLSSLVSIENLTRELSEKDEFIICYDMETKHGECCRKQVMFQWLDNSRRYIAAIQSDVSTTFRNETDRLDKLNRDFDHKIGKDMVTGLPNKNSSEVQISGRFSSENSAILLFELTNLVRLNNAAGRDIGNMLLYQFAHLITVSLPAGSFAGRYTGAEIIVLCNGLKHGDEQECLEKIAERIDHYNSENPDCPIEYVSSAVFARDHGDCDFPKLYAEAFRQLVESRNSKGAAAPESSPTRRNAETVSMADGQEYSSKHDGLTGLLNKTSGFEEISDITRHYPHRYHVMFVMDIDNFKHIDDTFGHDFGDAVLKKTSDIIRTQFRPDDVLIRYGGDEFIAFMADVAGPAQIEDKAQNLIDAVDTMLFECGCRKTGYVPGTGASDSTGISIGIVWTDKPAVATEMFVQADSALYDAKRAGKNRFEITRNMGIQE